MHGQMLDADGVQREEGSKTPPQLQRPRDCDFSVNILDYLEDRYVKRVAIDPRDPRLKHFRECAHCFPRYEAMRPLFESVDHEKSPDMLDSLPCSDSWKARLRAGVLTAKRSIRMTLQSHSVLDLPASPLDVHLDLVRSEGAERLRIAVPVQNQAPEEVLGALVQNHLLFELYATDPNEGWGYDTPLQLNREKTALVSAHLPTVPADFASFFNIAVTLLYRYEVPQDPM